MLRSLDELKECEVQQAYVMINCEDGEQECVIEELKSIECIKWIASVVGRYDIVTKIVASSIETLRETIEFKIRRIQKVRTTTTIICEKPTYLSEYIEGKMCYV
jgi:DNA-binding Lrp family transcriptional regulator